MVAETGAADAMQGKCSDIFNHLESWYGRDGGHYLLEATREATRDLLDTTFGYHILQLGLGGESPLCERSPINHRVYCADSARPGVRLVADNDELPLDSDSVDAIVAHHCLEFSARPHEALREMQRVLTPQGQLVIIGFNPYSLHGMGVRMRRLLRDPLWSQHQPVSENRLKDWLRLLGCDVQAVSHLYSLPPLGRGRLRNAMVGVDRWTTRHNLPLGGCYVIHAVKQVAGVHPPRQVNRGRRFIGLVPKPAAAPAPTPVTPAARQTDPDKKL